MYNKQKLNKLNLLRATTKCCKRDIILKKNSNPLTLRGNMIVKEKTIKPRRGDIILKENKTRSTQPRRGDIILKKKPRNAGHIIYL